MFLDQQIHSGITEDHQEIDVINDRFEASAWSKIHTKIFSEASVLPYLSNDFLVQWKKLDEDNQKVKNGCAQEQAVYKRKMCEGQRKIRFLKSRMEIIRRSITSCNDKKDPTKCRQTLQDEFNSYTEKITQEISKYRKFFGENP